MEISTNNNSKEILAILYDPYILNLIFLTIQFTHIFQSSLSHLQMELERERERNVQHREREETLHTKLMAVELELSHKQQDVDRLEKMLEVVKQECSNQIKEMVSYFISTLTKKKYICVYIDIIYFRSEM